MKEAAYRRRRPAASAPQQKDYNNDYQYRAEASAIIVEWRTQIETAAAKKENQNNQQQDEPHWILLIGEGVENQHRK
jgi:hypothetical protein